MTAIDANLFQTGYSNLSYSDVAAFLKRTLKVSDQKLITSLIQAEEYKLASQCNRQFTYSDTTYYEVVNAGFTSFKPANFPLATLSKILIDNVDKTSLYTLNTNYWVFDRSIRFLETVTGANYAFNAVRIEYTIKQFWNDDVLDYLKKAVAVAFLNSEHGGVALSSMGFADTNLTFSLAQFTQEQEALIARYAIPVV